MSACQERQRLQSELRSCQVGGLRRELAKVAGAQLRQMTESHVLSAWSAALSEEVAAMSAGMLSQQVGSDGQWSEGWKTQKPHAAKQPGWKVVACLAAILFLSTSCTWLIAPRASYISCGEPLHFLSVGQGRHGANHTWLDIGGLQSSAPTACIPSEQHLPRKLVECLSKGNASCLKAEHHRLSRPTTGANEPDVACKTQSTPPRTEDRSGTDSVGHVTVEGGALHRTPYVTQGAAEVLAQPGADSAPLNRRSCPDASTEQHERTTAPWHHSAGSWTWSGLAVEILLPTIFRKALASEARAVYTQARRLRGLRRR